MTTASTSPTLTADVIASGSPLARRWRWACLLFILPQLLVGGHGLLFSGLDWPWLTVPLVNGARAQVFVSAMDASSYVFACATPAQRLDDWIERMVRAPSFYSVCRVVLDFVAGNKIRHDVAHGSAEVAKRLLVQLRPLPSTGLPHHEPPRN